jgi:hypothetical protein
MGRFATGEMVLFDFKMGGEGVLEGQFREWLRDNLLSGVGGW